MDKKDVVFWVSFFYGLAVMTPFNSILSTLDFYENAMPDYPISFVVSFAINGIMVIVVLACIAYPEVGSHQVKVNLMFLVTSGIMLSLPFLTDFTVDKFGQKTCFWITVTLLCILGAITAIS